MSEAQSKADAAKETEESKCDLIFYVLPAQNGIVSQSPFCLKLMTYARMAGIEYDPIFDCKKPSSKGKYPWLQHKEAIVEDSSFCIDYLNETFEVDMDNNLTDAEKGHSLGTIRLCEENLNHVLMWERVLANDGAYAKRNFKMAKIGVVNSMALWGLRKYVSSNLRGHGIGRHSDEEIRKIAHDDIQAISRILGDKPFIFGEQPSRADATVFGLIANFVFDTDSLPQTKLIKEKFKNLEAYCNRMKERYWKDWDEIVEKAQLQDGETPAKEKTEPEKQG